jgi:two-component system nitrogen regulation sensor histidine kinase NtrY
MPAPIFGLESADDLIRQAVHLQEGARPGITFETRLPEREVRLYCDSSQVAQALTNLLQNAVDSITERGRRTEGAGRVEGHVRVRLEDDGEHVRIAVEDDGIGLPQDPVDRLTEPYFTTREQGTGLGLAIVKKIMEEHGGGLVFAGREPAGAAVTLVFPAAHVSGPAEYAAE